MLIEEAIPLLRNGSKIARVGWVKHKQYLYLLKSEAFKNLSSDVTDPVTDQIWIRSRHGKCGPFSLAQCDLMADDWVEYK